MVIKQTAVYSPPTSENPMCVLFPTLPTQFNHHHDPYGNHYFSFIHILPHKYASQIL